MPYAFAHPVAVIPLHRLLGRHAVASALAIGSVIPDAWYLLPFLSRHDAHSLAGLLLFCLPAGLFAYAAFHLIFKDPLLALLPRALAGRLHSFTSPGLPPAPWRAVVASIAAGALTHLAWDALTHGGVPILKAVVSTVGTYELRLHQALQHGSTLLGGALLAGWAWQRLRAAQPVAPHEQMSPHARNAIFGLLLSIAAIAGYQVATEIPWSGIQNIRLTLRAAGVTALSTLGLGMLAYCVLWRWHHQRRRLSDSSPRPDAAA